MKRRDVLKSIPAITMASTTLSAMPAQTGTREPRGASTHAAAAAVAARTQVTFSIIGLWLVDKDVSANAHVIAAINAAGVKIPNSAEMIHDHNPYLILPTDQVDGSATGGSTVSAGELAAWKWLPAGTYTKFPLSGAFELSGMQESATENVFAAFPIGQVNRGCGLPPMQTCSIKREWYKDANTAKAYFYLTEGALHDAPSWRGVKVTWTFDDASNKPNTDTPVRLTDTLEVKGSGPTIAINIAGKKINKPDLPAITGYLSNLPDKVSETEAGNKRVLHHTRAYYKVYDNGPKLEEQRIPRTTAITYPGGEPVFCPPGSML